MTTRDEKEVLLFSPAENIDLLLATKPSIQAYIMLRSSGPPVFGNQKPRSTRPEIRRDGPGCARKHSRRAVVPGSVHASLGETRPRVAGSLRDPDDRSKWNKTNASEAISAIPFALASQPNHVVTLPATSQNSHSSQKRKLSHAG
jgi:hypothetical protein